MPERIQRKRTQGWRMPEGAVYVGRPTDWGNPWSVGDGYTATVQPACDPARNNGRVIGESDAEVSAFVLSPEQAVALYEGAWLTDDMRKRARDELSGKDLACWCPLDQPCHADVLLEIANGGDRS
jgi:hypothetical protein